MSITISTDVFCDNCVVWVEGISGRGFVDKKTARKNAKIQGWISIYRNKKLIDLCPACQQTAKEKADDR